MISKLKLIFKNFIQNVIIETYPNLFNKYWGRYQYYIEEAVCYFFEDKFKKYFEKEFNLIIKDRINEHLEEVFTTVFDDEFHKRISDFKLQDDIILKNIQKAETKLKKGNGQSKLDLASEFYVNEHKEEILSFANDIIKKRTQEVFEKNKEQINNLVMDKPICL